MDLSAYVKRLIAVLIVFAMGTITASADTVLITGANRGIGLEFTKQYAARGWTVIATHRRDTIPETLVAAKNEYPERVLVETMDVTNHAQIDALSEKYAEQAIDVLINNAAIIGREYGDQQRFGTLNHDLFDMFMRTNVLGPLKISEAFLGSIKKSDQKRIIAISSMAGSLANSPKATPNRVFYKTSKSALNMSMSRIAAATKLDGISVAIISPGLVRTEALKDVKSSLFIEPKESVQNMMVLIDGLSVENTGLFWNHTGDQLPW